MRPTKVQDREVKREGWDPRFLEERLSNLKSCRGSLAPEEGGQGVLMHRKYQGLCAYPAHRLDDKASAIVSKTSRLTA